MNSGYIDFTERGPGQHGLAIFTFVASAAAQVAVPNVVGETQAAATTDITNAGLVLGTVTTQYSDSVAAGLVISQSPVGGTLVSLGSSISIVVSLGPQPSVAETPAGRSRRTRNIYRIKVDGESFEFGSLAAALQFLDKAKRTAAQLAANAVRQSLEKQRETKAEVVPPTFEPPKFEYSSRDLRGAVTETKREINEIFERAVRDAEIAIMVELAQRKQDEEIIWWLI